MKMKMILILLTGLLLLTGCTLPASAPPTPTQTVSATSTFIPTETPSLPTLTPEAFTAIPTLTFTPPPVASNICTDPQVIALIDSLKASMLTSNGALLSSLVSPARGMDVRYFRTGNVINYNQEQAKFLFETTFEANWGAEPGSGLDKTGSFHDVIVPELVAFFNQPYTLDCNELKHGGATYELTWPYEQDFYGLYVAGTESNGFMDWNTWAIGIEYVGGKPFIYAIMQFFWET